MGRIVTQLQYLSCLLEQQFCFCCEYIPKISVPIVSSLVGSAFFCSHQEGAVSMGSCSYKFSDFSAVYAATQEGCCL